MLIEAFTDALRRYESSGPDSRPLHLVIAGPDQVGWSAHLKRITTSLGINNRVTWTGMLSGDLKFGALHAADVFMLPSHQENFGIAAAEALACGLPVLLSGKVNIWREVDKDRAGLVDSDDAAGACRLLQKWLSLNPSEQDAYRTRARRCFAERFEITKAASDLLNVLCATTVPPRRTVHHSVVPQPTD